MKKLICMIVLILSANFVFAQKISVNSDFGELLDFITNYNGNITANNTPAINTVMNILDKNPQYLNRIFEHKTLLSEAGSAGSIVFIKRLTEKGAKVDQEGAISPLISATQNGKIKAVKYLVETIGADINAQTPISNQTALMESIVFSHKDIFDYLLTRENINIDMLNNSNKTALNYAFERFNNNGDDYYCEELLKKGTKIPENLLNNPKLE